MYYPVDRIQSQTARGRGSATLHVAFVQAFCVQNSIETVLPGRMGLAIVETLPVSRGLSSSSWSISSIESESRHKSTRFNYTLVLYHPSTKKTIVHVSICKEFQFLARIPDNNRTAVEGCSGSKGSKKSNEMLFLDNKQKRWFVRFSNASDLDDFCKYLALIKHYIANYTTPKHQMEVTVLDTCLGGGSPEDLGVSIGSTVKISYTIWRVESKHPVVWKEVLEDEQKRKIYIDPDLIMNQDAWSSMKSASKPSTSPNRSMPLCKGILLGILGLRKHSRRILVIPPDVYNSGNHTNTNTDTNTNTNTNTNTGKKCVSKPNPGVKAGPSRCQKANTNSSVLVLVKLTSVKHKKASGKKSKRRASKRSSKIQSQGQPHPQAQTYPQGQTDPQGQTHPQGQPNPQGQTYPQGQTTLGNYQPSEQDEEALQMQTRENPNVDRKSGSIRISHGKRDGDANEPKHGHERYTGEERKPHGRNEEEGGLFSANLDGSSGEHCGVDDVELHDADEDVDGGDSANVGDVNTSGHGMDAKARVVHKIRIRQQRAISEGGYGYPSLGDILHGSKRASASSSAFASNPIPRPRRRSSIAMGSNPKNRESEAKPPKAKPLKIKQETKPKAKQETKPKAKHETKPKAKQETKPKAKHETKHKPKQDSKPEARSEGVEGIRVWTPTWEEKVELSLKSLYKKVTGSMRQLAQKELHDKSWKEHTYTGNELIRILKFHLRQVNEDLKQISTAYSNS